MIQKVIIIIYQAYLIKIGLHMLQKFQHLQTLSQSTQQININSDADFMLESVVTTGTDGVQITIALQGAEQFSSIIKQSFNRSW